MPTRRQEHEHLALDRLFSRDFYRRHYFRRFLRPINRARLTPDTVGRTVMLGMAWGLSPTVGAQVIGLAATWALVDRLMGLRFSFAVALVLTVITNPVTVAPIYTLYYGTGCLLVPCGDVGPGLSLIIAAIAELELAHLAEASAKGLVKPMLIILLGSVPYVAVGAVLGWRFGHAVGSALLHRRRQRGQAAQPGDDRS